MSAAPSYSSSPRRRRLLQRLLVASAGLAAPARGQYAAGSLLFNESIALGEAAVSAALGLAPSQPQRAYVAADPAAAAQYTQNVIFDPCRYDSFACCNDTYGTPEFLAPGAGPTAELVTADGSPLPARASRRPDDEVIIDEQCTGDGQPKATCLSDRVGTRPFPVMPACWNYNDSIRADSPCRAPGDGSRVDLCMEVGITQTAYIFECGGAYADSASCGTFLEVHRPGDDGVLAETRLRGQYTSGYRMTLVSTTVRASPNRVICWDPAAQGRYELWWIQRTLHSVILQRRLPFAVVSPQCDWDAGNNRYTPFATLDAATISSGVRLGDGGYNPYDPARFLFSRPRTEGHPAAGIPGRGMGARTVAPAANSYPVGATFIDDDGNPDTVDPAAYTYVPDGPQYTVKSGYAEPPDVAPSAYRPL